MDRGFVVLISLQGRQTTRIVINAAFTSQPWIIAHLFRIVAILAQVTNMPERLAASCRHKDFLSGSTRFQ